MNLVMSKVESTNISAVGYDVNASLLGVQFGKDDVYVYFGVPGEVHSAFSTAHSKGKFFQENIKGRYVFSKITPVKAKAPVIDGGTP